LAEYVVELDLDGRIKIPTAVKEDLQLIEGDNLILRLQGAKVEMEKLPMTLYEHRELLTMGKRGEI
jgi:bifunctional DNA-binding transcriptional regulator/antitoxin component of YhaV-PrlF toxin-antitoxin module